MHSFICQTSISGYLSVRSALKANPSTTLSSTCSHRPLSSLKDSNSRMPHNLWFQKQTSTLAVPAPLRSKPPNGGFSIYFPVTQDPASAPKSNEAAFSPPIRYLHLILRHELQTEPQSPQTSLRGRTSSNSFLQSGKFSAGPNQRYNLPLAGQRATTPSTHCAALPAPRHLTPHEQGKVYYLSEQKQ